MFVFAARIAQDEAENENGLDMEVEAVCRAPIAVLGIYKPMRSGLQRCASDGHCSQLHAFSLIQG